MKRYIVTGLTVVTLGLTGCTWNDDATGRNETEYNRQMRTNETTPMHVRNEGRLRSLSISERAEREVEKLPEVDDAQVIVSGNNAYVAVRLKDHNVNNRRANNNLTGNGVVDQNNRTRDNGIIDGRNDAGNPENDPLNYKDNAMNDRYNGVRNINRNTRTTRNYTPISNRFEQKITGQVRKADSRIRKVYVSADPDFYSRMTDFGDNIRNNRLNDGLINDFNNLVNDIFNTGNKRRNVR